MFDSPVEGMLDASLCGNDSAAMEPIHRLY
jgi:hypothetical protein